MSRSAPVPNKRAVAAIAPTGVLRVGVNLANLLLVTGRDTSGDPIGVSPSLALQLARLLEVPLDLVSYVGPGEVVDALAADELDVGNIGADPDRSVEIAFTRPYCTIEATYLVRDDSMFESCGKVDQPRVRIVSKSRAAYTLWLDRNIKRAELVHTDTVEGAAEQFEAGGADALAGLRPGLLESAAKIPGTRLLDDAFTEVTQAIGINRSRDASGLGYLDTFVEWSIASGKVAELIEQFAVRGLTVPR